MKAKMKIVSMPSSKKVSFPASRLLGALLALSISILAPAALHAQDGGEVARLESAEGAIEAQMVGETSYKLIQIGTIFRANDIIHTTDQGRAAIKFADGGVLRLAENTTLQFRPVAAGDAGAGALEVASGKGFYYAREPENHPIVKTPAVSAAIRGTEFVFDVTAKRTIISVLDGSVECSNQYGSVLAAGGEQATTVLGQAPVKSIMVNPRDAVQWALYYPGVTDLGDLADLAEGGTERHKAGYAAMLNGDLDAASASFDGKSWRDVLGRAVVADRRGQRARALKELEAYKGDAGASLLLYRSAMLLSLGQVDRAQALTPELDRRIAKAPPAARDRLESAAAAQRSVIALTQDRKDEASALAERALKLSPRSPTAGLASAYVAQSRFDLEAARRHLRQTIEDSPREPLPRARLAEIELGFGEVRRAEDLVNEALALAPENAYALSVLGFIKLIENEIEEARAAFERAARSDSAMALPRLGLGLASIRDGRLEEGRAEIEMAVSLEPNVALYRSYLGKAFFEEEREHLAAREYNHAIELDPRDPTPYLYRAYNELSQNKPVKALQDVEKSIELNNDRAVYRSRLLLDQDLAVRSAGLAEVFNAMGFTEIARIEAIKSINQDYGNHSAHLLLADTYQSILLNDAAVSERQIAEALAPPSFNLFNNPPGGDASLNEYNALFDRRARRTELASTYISEDDLYAPRVGHSAKEDDYAYFLSYDGSYFGGSKDNQYGTLSRVALGGVYQPDLENRFSTHAGLELSHRFVEGADFEDVEMDRYSADIGYHRRLTPGSRLIAQVAANKRLNTFGSDQQRIIGIEQFSNQLESDFEDSIRIDEQTREYIGSLRNSLQYIYDSRYLSSVLGTQIGFTNVERDEDSPILDDANGFFPDIGVVVRSHQNRGLESQDYFSYNTLHLAPWVDLSLGVSYTDLELEETQLPPFVDEAHNRSKLSPKLGATFYPWEGTTIRGAYFEVLRKSALEDNASLEPTLVSGINQRFTDLAGDRSSNWGAGIDHKWAGSTYLGVEGIRRSVTSDIFDTSSQFTFDFDQLAVDQQALLGATEPDFQDQALVRGYIYQVLHEQLVATLDYQYAQFQRDDDTLPDYEDLQTHKIAAGIRYFDPSGLFTFARATWREQKFESGSGTPEELAAFLDGDRNFWVVDAGLGYRLPNRHGSVVLEVTNLLDEDFFYDQRQMFEDRQLKPQVGVRLEATYNF